MVACCTTPSWSVNSFILCWCSLPLADQKRTVLGGWLNCLGLGAQFARIGIDNAQSRVVVELSALCSLGGDQVARTCRATFRRVYELVTNDGGGPALHTQFGKPQCGLLACIFYAAAKLGCLTHTFSSYLGAATSATYRT